MTQVLVVDDDEDLCQAIARLITTLGDTHAVSANSLSDVQKLGDDLSGFQFAFLDMNLGLHQPNGIDVYHWLQAHRFQGKLVFFTGHARSHPLLIEAARLANIEILEKPVSSVTFKAIIRGTQTP